MALAYVQGSSENSKERGNLRGKGERPPDVAPKCSAWILTPSLTSPVTSEVAADFQRPKEKAQRVLGVTRQAQRTPRRAPSTVGGPRGNTRVGSGSGWAPRSAGVEMRLWEGRGSSCPRPWGPYGAPGLRRPRPSPHHPGGPTPSAELGHILTSAKDQRLRKTQLRTADSERSLSAQAPRGACREGGRSDSPPASAPT